jgi:CBS domain containing-hemolysin-like protein
VIADLSLAIPLAIACVVISAFCAGTEVALFSIRRLEREQLAQGKRFSDRRITAMLERPRRLIATVLVGNEACNALLAVLAFEVLYRHYGEWTSFWLAIAVALPVIVLVTEITAKTLAGKAPLGWSRLCVLPLAAFSLIVTPVRLVVQGFATLLLRPLGVAARPRATRDLSEAEFRTLVDAGSAQGQVDARERRLIHRVFEFNDKNVGQVMTPRERIFALSYDLPAQRLVKELAARGFSRVPIYQKSLDNVRGILNAKDLVRTTAGQPLGRPLGELLHEPLFVPRTTPVKRLFLTFKQKKVHMAIVVSEYGKVLGLVTMDDLLSQIFGVLRDERAELQNSVPMRRVPAAASEVKPDAGTGPVLAPVIVDEAVPLVRPADDDLVHRGDDRSGPVTPPDSTLGTGLGVLDPPPRPIHVVDEVTPPATDLHELTRGRTGEDGRSR